MISMPILRNWKAFILSLKKRQGQMKHTEYQIISDAIKYFNVIVPEKFLKNH
jgi:hypothetical protein